MLGLDDLEVRRTETIRKRRKRREKEMLALLKTFLGRGLRRGRRRQPLCGCG
jgi:hypothetical protein